MSSWLEPPSLEELSSGSLGRATSMASGLTYFFPNIKMLGSLQMAWERPQGATHVVSRPHPDTAFSLHQLCFTISCLELKHILRKQTKMQPTILQRKVSTVTFSIAQISSNLEFTGLRPDQLVRTCTRCGSTQGWAMSCHVNVFKKPSLNEYFCIQAFWINFTPCAGQIDVKLLEELSSGNLKAEQLRWPLASRISSLTSKC